LLQENLNKAASVESDVTSSKEPKVADSNGATPGAQSSPPEDDDDGPSEDGAAGDGSTLQALIAEFSRLELDQLFCRAFGNWGVSRVIILTVFFEMDSFSSCEEEKEEKQGKVSSVIQLNH
jgi:hypothetical protein